MYTGVSPAWSATKTSGEATSQRNTAAMPAKTTSVLGEDHGYPLGATLEPHGCNFSVCPVATRGSKIRPDDSLLLCFNAHHEPMSFTLPSDVFGARWQRVIDPPIRIGKWRLARFRPEVC